MALVGAGLVIALVQIFDLVGLRLNTSPSLPVGLYMTTADPAAVEVEFCPAPPFAGLALDRQYRSAGNCKDGGAPLLKPVVAKSGDVVDVSRMGIPGKWAPVAALSCCESQECAHTDPLALHPAAADAAQNCARLPDGNSG
jgi:type IV secretory pathway protease TraF